MADPVKIANQALFMLGENTITSFEEETNEARIASAFYSDARDYVLADVRPPFARKRVTVTAPLESTDGRFGLSYQLPTDCLVVVEAGTDERPTRQWRVFNRRLESRWPLNWFEYVMRGQETEAYMDGVFVKALVAYLAHELAFALIGDKTRVQELLEVYNFRAAEARNIYGLQSSFISFSDSDLVVRR